MSAKQGATLERVRQIVADIFLVEMAQVTERSSPETLENWDSLQHLNLVVALEGSFGLSLSPEEIAAMTSVADIVKIIDGRRS